MLDKWKLFHFHWNIMISYQNKAMLFISRTNRKHDVKNMINKKVNYTINHS